MSSSTFLLRYEYLPLEQFSFCVICVIMSKITTSRKVIKYYETSAIIEFYEKSPG